MLLPIPAHRIIKRRALKGWDIIQLIVFYCSINNIPKCNWHYLLQVRVKKKVTASTFWCEGARIFAIAFVHRWYRHQHSKNNILVLLWKLWPCRPLKMSSGPQEVHRPWVKNYYARVWLWTCVHGWTRREKKVLDWESQRPERPKCWLNHHMGADVTEKDRNIKGKGEKWGDDTHEWTGESRETQKPVGAAKAWWQMLQTSADFLRRKKEQ